MTVSFAQLNSNVWLSLGKPERELCEQDQIHFACRQALMLRTGQVSHSDNNQFIELSAEFTPDASPYNISAIITTGVEAWIEQKVSERWLRMRVVGLAELEDLHHRGISAAAFHGTREGDRFVSFSYPVSVMSTTVYRIRYDQTSFSFSIANPKGTHLPDYLTTLLEIDAMIQLIPDIIIKISNQIENEDGRKLLGPKIAALELKLAELKETRLNDWLPLFRQWKNRSKSAQGPTKLPNKSSRGLYGS